MSTKAQKPLKGKKIRMKIKGFEISNDITLNDTLKHGFYYNHELMDLFLNSILLLDLDKRKYKNDEVTLNLVEYKQSSNINVMEGIFTTARHGIRKTTINIETQEEMNTIEHYEGVKNEIHFTLDKKKGLLLVQEDKQNHVFSRSILKSFLYSHRHLIYPYIEEFNRKNLANKASLYKRGFYSINSLPPIDFIEKLNEFKTIKSGILYINSSENNQGNNDVIQKLEEELNDHEINEYDIEMKIKNKSPYGMVKTFEKYFNRMMEIQKYDDYAIEGVTKSGATKKITPDSITREFDIEVQVNSKGIPNLDDIFNGMESIILHKNPLVDKEEFDQLFFIKDDTSVQKKIQEIANAINKPEETQEEERTEQAE
ncbi:hypothetical protein ACULLL_16715 [Lysinibacillus irui]|uniref:hypothetical protein n=1 Tax=Lysinibacillus irui TaxID=2998077 RepID=UPI004044A49A